MQAKVHIADMHLYIIHAPQLFSVTSLDKVFLLVFLFIFMVCVSLNDFQLICMSIMAVL